MRIGIDIRPLQTESGWRGVGVYTRYLVDTLMSIDRENDYFLFASPGKTMPLPDHLRRMIVPLKRPTRNIFLWDQLFWYPLLKKQKIDVFHSPFYASPLLVPGQVAVVQTVHDLIPLLFKESTSFKNRFLFRMNFSFLRYADRIIAVSQNTKNDIIRLLGVPEEKVVVIHNGADHLQKMRGKERSSTMSASKERPFLLYVGGMDPLKNIPTLVEAFDRICQRNKDLKLVMVGADGEKMNHAKPLTKDPASSRSFSHQTYQALLKRHIHSGRIILKGYLNIPDLIAYYKNAELFLFPSLYEGFGFPPLEAMSFGLPVVSSNRSSLPEILGDAALFANADNAEDLARAVEHLLHDDSLKAKLKEAGFKRATRFWWEDAARKTIALYQTIHREKVEHSTPEI